MSRRRKQAGGRAAAKHFLSEDLKNEVTRLMDNRRRLLAPFPVAAEEIYRLAWTQQEFDAIQLLKGKERLFETSHQVRILNWNYPIGGNNHRVLTITMKKAQPTCGYYTEVKWDDVPLEFANPIVDWAPVWLKQKQEMMALLLKIEELSEVCGSYGQVYRMWPDILGFMDKGGKEKVYNAKVRSKLPDYAVEYVEATGKWTLKEEFRPEAFEEFNLIIAECLMLPFVPGNEVAVFA